MLKHFQTYDFQVDNSHSSNSNFLPVEAAELTAPKNNSDTDKPPQEEKPQLVLIAVWNHNMSLEGMCKPQIWLEAGAITIKWAGMNSKYFCPQ